MLTINTKAIVGRMRGLGMVRRVGQVRQVGRVVSYPKNINFSQSTINKNFDTPDSKVSINSEINKQKN